MCAQSCRDSTGRDDREARKHEPGTIDPMMFGQRLNIEPDGAAPSTSYHAATRSRCGNVCVENRNVGALMEGGVVDGDEISNGRPC